jgi:vacuolar protein sorting-associated protein IST1
MFGTKWDAAKLKPRLKMANHRLQIATNKKSALMKQQKREIAKLLAEEPLPKEEKARIRAEALIRDDNTIEAYEILQLECELIHERIKLLNSTKHCPADMASCIATLIYASDRVDIIELTEIRKQFRAKYGKDFEQAALANTNGILNERVVAKLSVHPPTAILVNVSSSLLYVQFVSLCLDAHSARKSHCIWIWILKFAQIKKIMHRVFFVVNYSHPYPN